MFKKESLKKMKMPESKSSPDEMLMMEDEMESPEEEAMPMEEEMMGEEASPYADAPDEDLIAELEARGFDVEALRASMEQPAEGEAAPAEDMMA